MFLHLSMFLCSLTLPLYDSLFPPFSVFHCNYLSPDPSLALPCCFFLPHSLSSREKERKILIRKHVSNIDTERSVNSINCLDFSDSIHLSRNNWPWLEPVWLWWSWELGTVVLWGACVKGCRGTLAVMTSCRRAAPSIRLSARRDGRSWIQFNSRCVCV